MRTRIALRTAAIATGVVVAMSLTAPAWAGGVEDGVVPGSHLGVGLALAIFGGIPLALFALISLLCVGPGLARRPRYRPGRPWTHDPVWFAGPPDPDAAVRAAVPRLQAKGGVGADW